MQAHVTSHVSCDSLGSHDGTTDVGTPVTSLASSKKAQQSVCECARWLGTFLVSMADGALE